MRIVELINSLQMPITNEESDLLKKFNDTREVPKRGLSEREQYIAGKLVERDVLIRRKIEGKIVYSERLRR